MNPFSGSVPRSLARASSIRDVRSYNGIYADAANPTSGVGGTPIERINNFGESPWSRVVRETPGKVHWWRFDRLVDLGTAQAAYDCWGIGTILTAPATGGVSLVPGLIPGDRGKAIKLDGTQFFRMSDYRVRSPGSQNVFTLECWLRLDASVANTAIFGEWGSNGHMLHIPNGQDLWLVTGPPTTSLQLAGTVFELGKVYHVVGVFGGLTKASVIYLNGEVAGTSAVGALSGTGNNDGTVPFEFGNFSNNGGGKMQATIDEAVMYDRMLQPDEVRQHYQAAFARSA